MFDLILQF